MNQIPVSWVKQKTIAFLLCQAKGTSGLLCLPSRELDEGFNNWFKGKVPDKIRVCVGLVLSGGWSTNLELFWSL